MCPEVGRERHSLITGSSSMPTGTIIQLTSDDITQAQARATESRALQGLPPETTDPAIADRLVVILDREKR